jgi:hypothetical protein
MEKQNFTVSVYTENNIGLLEQDRSDLPEKAYQYREYHCLQKRGK